MIVGKWVKASFYVSEVMPEKHGHVRIEASAIRHRRIGMGAQPSGSTVPSSRLLRKPAHDEAVPDIPGDAWQLACAIGDARGDAGKRIAHASLPAVSLYPSSGQSLSRPPFWPFQSQLPTDLDRCVRAFFR